MAEIGPSPHKYTRAHIAPQLRETRCSCRRQCEAQFTFLVCRLTLVETVNSCIITSTTTTISSDDRLRVFSSDVSSRVNKTHTTTTSYAPTMSINRLTFLLLAHKSTTASIRGKTSPVDRKTTAIQRQQQMNNGNTPLCLHIKHRGAHLSYAVVV